MPSRVERLSNHIVRLNLEGNVCAFFVMGDDRALLVDTGYGVQPLTPLIRSITDKPIDVVLTHGHYDHVGGAGEFDHVHVPKNDRSLALAHADRLARAEGLAANGVLVDQEALVAPLTKSQLVTYEPGFSFDLGGVTVRMLPLYGHTRGMHCPLVEPGRTLLLGDACNSLAFMQFDEATSIEEYRDNLVEFEQRYTGLYDQVYYSHPHNFGTKQVLSEMIGLCEEVMADGFEPVDFQAALGEGVFLAKPVGADFSRLDGGVANMAYRPTRVFRA